MARIKLQDENSILPEIKSVYDEIKEKTGGNVPAAYRAFGIQSHILQANWNRTKRILSEGILPQSLKESIALAVSATNGCQFCINIHQNNLLNQEFTQAEVDAITQAASNDAKTDFVLKLCAKATKFPEKVSDKDFIQLRKYGYTDEGILEILTVMEMYTGYNKIIVALDLQVED